LYLFGVLGKARVARRLGDEAGARAAYATLFDLWKEADANLLPLVEARREARELP
jgi:hypothetical protein